MKQLPTYQSFVFGKEDGDTGVNLAHGQGHQHLGGYYRNCCRGVHLKGGRLGVVGKRVCVSTADREHEVEASLSLSLSGEYPCPIGLARGTYAPGHVSGTGMSCISGRSFLLFYMDMVGL